METTNQHIILELPLISVANNLKMVVKKYEYGGYDFINLCEFRQLKGKWFPSNTHHLTFPLSYLTDFLKIVHQVRTNRHQKYTSNLHIVFNNPTNYHPSKVIDGKNYIINSPWSKEYMINVSKSRDKFCISKSEYDGIMYRNRFTFEIPNKRQLIKKLYTL